MTNKPNKNDNFSPPGPVGLPKPAGSFADKVEERKQAVLKWDKERKSDGKN